MSKKRKLILLSDLGEREIVRRLISIFEKENRLLEVGPGDDCAVIKTDFLMGKRLVLTSDAVSEGVHFKRGTDSFKVGYKAISRIISDFAAMGAEPKFILCNLSMPDQTSWDYIKDICRAVHITAQRYGSLIVGGDISLGAYLRIDCFGAGTAGDNILLRNRAKPGDYIYVTGEIGMAVSSGKHLVFKPRLKEGIWLAEGNWSSCAIDISDGLFIDLGRILENSRTGAIIYEKQIPITKYLRKGSKKSIIEAISEGEDYELLFTVDSKQRMNFEKEWKRKFDTSISCIGNIVKGESVIRLVRKDDSISEFSGGFEYFKK